MSKFKQPVAISAAVVTLSAIAHSALLWLPMPETEAEKAALSSSPPAQSKEDISVVILPDDKAVAPQSPVPKSPPQSPAPPQPVAQNPPSSLLPTDVIPETPQPVSENPPAEPTQSRLNVPEPPLAEDELPVEDGQAATDFNPPADDGPLLNYGDRFPHIAGAVGGCFGLSECRQVSGAGTYRAVARSLIAGLEDQGYGVRLRNDLEDTGRNVYELTPPTGESANQFLMVFSGDDGSAIYVMSPEIMTLDELKSLAAQAVSDRQSV